MTTEKAQIGVYEYLESIGVPRVNALQVQSKASEWFEFENAKAGGGADAPFGVRGCARWWSSSRTRASRRTTSAT